MKDDRPPNKGLKRIPIGAPNCLENKAFVITGTQDSLEREEATALIQKYGGRVTTAVSGKTSFVLRGIDSDSGVPVEGSKVQKARQLKTTIIDEDELLAMIAASAPQPPLEEDEEQQEVPEPMHPDAATAATLQTPAAGGNTEQTAEAVPMRQSARSAYPDHAVKNHEADPLWAEKYRPRSLGHLVGNADHVKRLTQWLQTWRERLRNESSKASKDQAFHKAALLSGPPGVGKTSSARVVLAHCGYDVVELNASDTRSQKALKAIAEDLVSNTSIADFASGHPDFKSKSGKMALVMDEVDGMSSGDRGGMAQLIATLKTSKMPVNAKASLSL